MVGEGLFFVQNMPTLPKPYINPIDKALADEEEPSLQDFERIMMENCDYEKRIN